MSPVNSMFVCIKKKNLSANLFLKWPISIIGKMLNIGADQWCSLVFCSEYTVIFFLPSLIRTRAASHTTLAKQGSTLTTIFRSTCAAN